MRHKITVLGQVLAIVLLPAHAVIHAQVCSPCELHCSALGSEANATCVANGGGDPNPPHGDPFLGSHPLPDHPPGQCIQEQKRVESSCNQACFICHPSTLHPDYLLISVLYAPPGNASTASFANSASTGTLFGFSTNIADSEVTSTSASIGLAGNGVSFDTRAGTSSSNGNSKQVSISVTSTTTDYLRSTGDFIDHGKDVFLIWINPVVTLTKEDQNTLAASIASVGPQQFVIPVTVDELKVGGTIKPEHLNDTKVCPTSTPDSCYFSPGLRFLTEADKASILAQDPLVSAPPDQPPLDTQRYVYKQSNPLESTAKSDNVSSGFTLTSTNSTSSTTTQTTGFNDGSSAGISFHPVAVGFSLSSSDSWTWTTGQSNGASSGTAQQTSITLSSITPTCCDNSNGYTCEVSIYEDTVYHTFAFVPQPESCQIAPATTSILPHNLSYSVASTPSKDPARPASRPRVVSLKGAVTRNGIPLKSEQVEVDDAAGNLLYRILTDSHGRFFSGFLEPQTIILKTMGKVSLGTIKSGETTTVNVTI